MPQNFSQPGNDSDTAERRQHPRQMVNSLAYLDIGPDNGGIIVNISEGGLALHAVGSLPPDPLIELRMQFSKSMKRMETTGKVAWTSGSKKDAGIEFIDLPEEDYLQIKEWLCAQNSSERFPSEKKPKPMLAPPPIKMRTEKWIKLAAELPDPPVGIVEHTADVSAEPAEQKFHDGFRIDETPPSEPAEPPIASHPDLTASGTSPAAPPMTDEGAKAAQHELASPGSAAEISPSGPVESRFFEENKPPIEKDSQGNQDSLTAGRPADDFIARARAIILAKSRAGSEASQKLVADGLAAARDFWSRNSAGNLAAIGVAAVVCLGLGMVLGRSLFKQAPKTTVSVNSAPAIASQTPPAAAAEESTNVEEDTNRDASESESRSSRRRTSSTKSASRRNGAEKNTPKTPNTGVSETEQEAPTKTGGARGAVNLADPVENSSTVAATVPVQTQETAPPPSSERTQSSESGYSIPPPAQEVPRALGPPDRLLPSYLIYRVAPSYPQEAMDQKIEGTVKIHLIVGRNGRVKNLRVVSGPQPLHQAALDAAEHWRYIPALRNGEPIETEEDINIVFRLPQ
jgi:TonB family protein